MKEKLHPTWYPEATVTCACGNTWTTGATVPEIRTDICSACHPFYTGEQRIVDTEGQVDRFMKRLQVRDAKRAEVEEREAAKTPSNLPLSELGVDKRYINILAREQHLYCWRIHRRPAKNAAKKRCWKFPASVASWSAM